MPISSPEQYADAQRWAESGVDDEGEVVDMQRLRKAMQRWERFAMPEKATAELIAQEGNPAGLAEHAAEQKAWSDRWDEAEAPPPAVAPSQEKNGYWAPPRPLSTADFVTEDAFGKLKVWHDMPVEVFREQVAAPARDKAVQDGLRAEMELRQYGLGAFSPEDLAARTQLVEAGRKAQQMDLGSITEESPEFRAYNDQLWSKAIQERAADPEAGPIQRFTKMTGLDYARERAKRSILAAARGAGDTMTLGAASGISDLVAENAPDALGGGREAVEFQRGVAKAHPYSYAAGNILGMLNPYTAGPAAARMLYGLGSKSLGALGGAALAGGATAAAQGVGQNLSEMVADAASSDPDVEVRERPVLEQANSDAAFGAAGGILGEGVIKPLGGAIYNKAADLAARLKGRPVLEMAEEGGFKLSPVRGIVDSDEARAYRRDARLAGYGDPGQYGASRVSEPINDAVMEADALLKGRHSDETSKYLSSTSAAKPAESTWRAIRSALTTVDSPQMPHVQKALAEWSNVEPVPEPPKNWGRRTKEFYLRAGELRGIGARDVDLTPDAQAVAGQLAELPDEAWVKLTPRTLTAADFYAKKQTLSKLAQDADTMKDGVLARVWRQAEAGALDDRNRFPATKSVKGLTATVERAGGEPLEVKGWSAQQAQQHAERTAMERDVQLTGARSGRLAGDAVPDQLAELNRKVANVGRANSPKAVEDALLRYAPSDEVRRELLMLRGIQVMDDARNRFDTGLTRAGMLRSAARLLPGVDMLSESVPGRTAAVGQALGGDVNLPGPKMQGVSDGTPISDALFSWLNARMPRATMFVPGMDVAKMIGEEDRIRNKPVKSVGDLTPQQRQLLQEVLHE